MSRQRGTQQYIDINAPESGVGDDRYVKISGGKMTHGLNWALAFSIITTLGIITIALVTGFTLHYACVAADNTCCVQNSAYTIGVARGQTFEFEPTLAEGAECRLSAQATPESVGKNSPASCLECPCYPTDLVWTENPNKSNKVVNKLCPVNCDESTTTPAPADAKRRHA